MDLEMEAFSEPCRMSDFLQLHLLLLWVAYCFWITLVERVLYALTILLKNEYLLNISIHTYLKLRYLVKINHSLRAS